MIKPSDVRAQGKAYFFAMFHPARSLTGKVMNAYADGKLDRREKQYLARGVTINRFFQTLNDRNVRYVVLRWFEDLPNVEPGHDIDILIADDDAEKPADLLSYWPGPQRVDLYSETGLGRLNFAPLYERPSSPHEMSVFPPYLAQRLLDGAVTHNGMFKVPNPRDHFFSLAYHAVYLKAEASGLKTKYTDLSEGWKPTRDYAAILPEMGRAVGVDVPDDPSLEELDRILAENDWRPPMDTLERIGVWSPWVRRHFFQERYETSTAPRGLTVFFIRERALTTGMLDRIEACLDSYGFEILSRRDLTGDELERVSRSYRGGNWSQGPYPENGGLPTHIVAAIDVFAMDLDEGQTTAFPLLTNRRVLEAKKAVRKIVTRMKGPDFNPMHSTDSEPEAEAAIRDIFGDEADAIIDLARERLAEVAMTPEPVAVLSGLQRRARVELIEHEGRRAVRKVFRRNSREFMEREIRAMEALSESAHVPRLIETGQRHIVIEYVENDWRSEAPTPLPFEQVRQLSEFVALCGAKGIDPIDVTPGKNLLCADGTIKVIDFEFAYERGGAVEPRDLYVLKGAPKDFPHPLPVDTPSVHGPYKRQWFPYTAMDFETFTSGDESRQRRAWMRNRAIASARGTAMRQLRGSKVGRYMLKGLRRLRS